MLAAKLKLVSRKNCFISLPKQFTQHEPKLNQNPNAVLCIKPIKDNSKLFVTWDGTLNDESYELDFNFGKANNLTDGETIIVELVQMTSPMVCKFCSIVPLKPEEYEMLESKSSAIENDLLNRITIVSESLSLPIWLSERIKVMVKISYIEPLSGIVALSNDTELQVVGGKNTQNTHAIRDIKIADNELAFLDSCLGLRGQKNVCCGTMLVCGPKGSGKTHYVNTIFSHYYGIYSYSFDCKNLCDMKPDSINRQLMAIIQDAIKGRPAILCLENVDLLLRYDAIHEGEKGFEIVKRLCIVNSFCKAIKKLERDNELPNVAIIMTSTSHESLHPRINNPIGRKFFSYIKMIGAFDEVQRRQMIFDKLRSLENIDHRLDSKKIDSIVKRTDTYLPLDISNIIEQSIVSSMTKQLDRKFKTLELDDINSCLDRYIPIGLRGINLQTKSNINFSSVGGMKKIKSDLSKIILFQVKYPNLMKQAPIQLQTHILLHGPPGCGKTLIAEAVANEQEFNFICIKGPELFSKYIGGSEAAIRGLFERAEAARPCIVLFDEFDSIAPKRGHDSTGVTDRVVNQLLTLLDGAQRLKSGVYIIASSSRPDLIDPALLRPGRLDKHIYCGLPDTEDRYEIILVLGKHIRFNSDVNLKLWAEKMERFTGADIQYFLHTSQIKALHKLIDEDKVHSDKQIVVNEGDLQATFEGMKKDVEKRYQRTSKLTNPSVRQLKISQVIPKATLA